VSSDSVSGVTFDTDVVSYYYFDYSMIGIISLVLIPTTIAATAANGLTVYVYLPSPTPILVLILIVIPIIIMMVIVLLFLQAVFLPRLYNDVHCLFRTRRALLLLILLSDSGGLDDCSCSSDTVLAHQSIQIDNYWL